MVRLGLVALLLAACSAAAAPVVDVPDLGVIVFGKDYDPDTLDIVERHTKFRRNRPTIAWSASLSEAVGATSIEITIARRSKGGAEELLLREEVGISNPDSDTFANKLDLALLVDNKAGTYVMRYVRDGDVLAEGTFELVKE